jgi:very-short-patch-repair endonuclease
MTKAEVFLWMELKNRKLLDCKFRRQYSVDNYVLDFYSPVLHLAIEIDGSTHISQDEIEYDKNRQSEIENLGIKFLRFTNDEIYQNKNIVLERIRKTIQELKDVNL